MSRVSRVQVINMINVAQESSPATVVQALDKVLEILRTSELYAPHLPPQLGRDDDPMTSDLVGGLVSVSGLRCTAVSVCVCVCRGWGRGCQGACKRII